MSLWDGERVRKREKKCVCGGMEWGVSERVRERVRKRVRERERESERERCSNSVSE